MMPVPYSAASDALEEYRRRREEREMREALAADGKKLRQITGQDHGPFPMPRTYFHDFERDDGSPITVEYAIEDGTCAYIVDAWPRTEEYNRLWAEKNRIETGAYGNKRHFLGFTEEEREVLNEINSEIERAKFELTEAEHERMGAWLSENHIQESDDIEF